MKSLRYLIEAIILIFTILFFKLIGLRLASALSTKLALLIGKRMSVNRMAAKNLAMAAPSISSKKRGEIIDKMWVNLGLNVAEFTHICSLKPCEIRKFINASQETINNLNKLAKRGRGGIIFSAHIGNWEIGPKLLASFGIKIDIVYRPLNNPYAERIIANLRSSKVRDQVTMVEKGAKGNRKIIDAIRGGRFILILADQRVGDGQLVKFFHQDALTSTSLARIALKYDVDLIPSRIIRIGDDFKFEVEVEEPIEIKKELDINLSINNITRQINRKLEGWVLEHPEQWFWVHNRWKG